MPFLLSLLDVYKCQGKNAYNNSLCNLSSSEIKSFNDFKEGFVNRIREKLKKKILRKAIKFFG